jgi:predicted nucleic acid-binding protein
MAGHQVFLAAVTVAELRYGALVADWGDERRRRLEQSIAAATAVPVSDSLLTTAAELRHACRQTGHALHEPVHANDLWIAASAVHIGAPLLTADAVFEDVPELSLHRWRSPTEGSGATFGDALRACGGSALSPRASPRYACAIGGGSRPRDRGLRRQRAGPRCLTRAVA